MAKRNTTSRSKKRHPRPKKVRVTRSKPPTSDLIKEQFKQKILLISTDITKKIQVSRSTFLQVKSLVEEKVVAVQKFFILITKTTRSSFSKTHKQALKAWQSQLKVSKKTLSTAVSQLRVPKFSLPALPQLPIMTARTKNIKKTIFRAPLSKRWLGLWKKFRRTLKKTSKRWQKQLKKKPSQLLKKSQLTLQKTNTLVQTLADQLLSILKKTAWIISYPFVQVVKIYPVKAIVALLSTFLILGGSYALYDFVFRDLPTATELITHRPIVSTKIFDRHGELLFSIYKDENRTPVPLSEIPTNFVNATIAIEDQNYWHHFGFDVKGIIRAVIANFEGKKVQGGSTITQQLVKNTLLNSEQSLQRKIRELLVAVTIEGNFSKTEILEMYFNEIPYGGSTYGAEEAAQRFFGKHARELTLAESAFLAGLPAAPTAYSPFGPTPELAYARQAEVLRRMVEDKYITEEEAAAARHQVLQFRTDSIDIKAPHFVMYVRQLLSEQYGDQLLTQGGLEVTTTLDLRIQTLAEESVRKELSKLQRLRVGNGAALVTNPKTGEILAMVGSKDYFDFDRDGQVNVTLRPRQPGSSIKPLTYALAFERGDSPATTIDDSPISYHIPGSPPYAPKNYDGKFHGKVSLREALASSYNIPAVKLLAKLGINNVIDKAEQMGITTWTDRQRYGLSLTLGGGEVLMTDMAKLYGTFANQGKTVDINPLLQVATYNGTILYRNTCALDLGSCPGQQTLDPKVALQITNILSDNVARSPAFGPRSVLYIPGQEVAVKTGTTNNLKDNWTDGYTSDYVVITWVGNNDGSSMSYVASGITGASPIWNSIMSGLLDSENPHHFTIPAGLVKVKVCAATGTLPCTGCPAVREELFVAGSEPKNACNPSWFTALPKASPDPNRDKILTGTSL